MKTDLFFFIAGLLTAEAVYLFRSVISAWVKKQEAAAQAKIAAVTTPKA
jgi:hypothetical protein